MRTGMLLYFMYSYNVVIPIMWCRGVSLSRMW